MKTITETLVQRTSVRRYERKAIEPEKSEQIFEAIRNSPTSYNGQQFSVIAVTDQTLKEELYRITGQKQIKTCALFLIFCIDYQKITQLAAAKNLSVPPVVHTLEGYTVGVVDAALAMQNAVVAAQGLGLGCCCIGYARTASPERISQLLGLPKRVAIVCGLTIGYPAEHPDRKPKQPLSLVIHSNGYRSDEMTDELLAYDAEISRYNRERSGTQTDNDWCEHILDYYYHAVQPDTEAYMAQQGFCPDRKEN